MAVKKTKATCPLSGAERYFSLTKDLGLHFFDDKWLGKWAITDRLYKGIFTQPEFASVRALIASIAFGHKLGSQDNQPCILSKEDRQIWDADPNTKSTVKKYNLNLYSFEELILEERRLTLEEKAYQTLRTLRILEKLPGTGLQIPVSLKTYPGKASFNPEDEMCPIGIAYACIQSEIPIVFHMLKDEGLIQPRTTLGYGERIHITPAGYKLADRTLQQPSKRAFVICRFKSRFDNIYESVYKKVCSLEKVDCPAFRAKDIPHIDKCDDRIIYEIRNSAVIIVDITECNFNVGFEAGLAMAYNKPVVWCCNEAEIKKEEWTSTFDIHGQNILFYEEDKLDLFCERLEHRILAALNRW